MIFFQKVPYFVDSNLKEVIFEALSYPIFCCAGNYFYC